ncbi:uncharacterized protein Dvar_67970 [Desulfosarcina variabilis str. Montpellier]|uniref:hypothetical protein n=1 Tax=Desulfosarcina variabilis TaxID=2300 RepID=UPI003AFABFF5
MGAILSVIDDDFQKIKNYGYIEDKFLTTITKIADDNSCICLSYILGFENTVFNSAQMEDIIAELKKIYPFFNDDKTIKILDNIKAAIDFALKDPPLYLLFEGD